MSDKPAKPKAKSPKKVTSSITWDASVGTLTIKWRDSQDTVLNLGELPVEVQTDLMYMGCVSKVQNSYVSAQGSPQFAREKVAKLWEALKSGKAGLHRGENSQYSITTQALALLLQVPVWDAHARFQLLDTPTKRQVGNRHDVLAMIAKIKAEAAPATTKLADMLK